ncbi:hypothetical protein M3Y94_00221600 [Aphelenchoides besseyi]|nr:hypothetical protein M3Y94_00221600 [Aphelenchoides besseyi]KAI6236527.1 hypothetical protein M3Y95_00167200 [Aphelenchoides besseyi]
MLFVGVTTFLVFFVGVIDARVSRSFDWVLALKNEHQPSSPASRPRDYLDEQFEKGEKKLLEMSKRWQTGEVPIEMDEHGCPLNIDYQCNNHNKQFLCTCHQSNLYVKMEFRNCDDVIRLYNSNISMMVVQFEIEMPIESRYMNEIDDFFTDLIEEMTSIRKKYVLMLRKECEKGRLIVQIVFVKPKAKIVDDIVHVEQLQATFPSVFVENKKLMNNKFVHIFKVSMISLK